MHVACAVARVDSCVIHTLIRTLQCVDSHVVRALLRALFHVSIACYLRVVVVRSRVRAACLAHALSRAVRVHHHASFAHGHTWSCALFVCSFARGARTVPMSGARCRRIACFS